MSPSPTLLWHRRIAPPRRRVEALDPVDVYLIFRRAFLRDRRMRVALHEEPDALVVLLEHRPTDSRLVPASARVSVPWPVLEVGARGRIEKEALAAVRWFYGAQMCASKRRYDSRVDADHALVALVQLNLRGERPRKRADAEKRAYLCEHCGGWHLTSQLRRPRPARAISRATA